MSSSASSDNIKMSTAAKTTKAAASKTAAPKATEAVVPVAAAAPVAAAVPAAKATKATKAKATETVAAPVVAAPAPIVAAPAVAATDATATTEVAADETVATLNKSVSRLAEINAQQKSLAVEAAGLTKAIEKLTARLAKKAEKRSRKGKGNGGKAFTIPLQITHELEAFLGLPKDTKVCRKDVNAGVYAYAKSHGLMKGKEIFPDASLRKILGVTETTQVTILNIMKFLNHHYIKPAAPAAN